MNRLTFTNDLTPTQQAGRNFFDGVHNVGRVIGNAGLAPAKVVDKVLFGGGHVHWIKSRHEQRKADRPAAGMPRHHGEFVAQQQDKEAQIVRAREALNKAYHIKPKELPKFQNAVESTADALHEAGKINNEQRDLFKKPDFVTNYAMGGAHLRVQQIPPGLHDDFFKELHTQLEEQGAYPSALVSPAHEFEPGHVPRSAFDHGYVPGDSGSRSST